MPTVVAMVLQSIVNEIDLVFFAQLPCPESSTGQAALMPSLILVWLFGGTLSAVSVGTQALGARRFVERDYEGAGAVLANGAFFCLIAGLVMTIAGWFIIPHLLTSMSLPPVVRQTAIEYSQWRILGVVSMSMTQAIKAFFDGIGKTHFHLVASVVMNVVNVFFCWTFIFGHLGAPRMGAPGAGLAAFLATWLGLLVMLVYVGMTNATFRPLHVSKLSGRLTWDLLKLSIPAGVATSVMMLGFGMFEKIVNRLDAAGEVVHIVGKCGESEPVNGAATTVIIEILKITFTACIAFGTSAATLVSQSLGAKRPDHAVRFGWATVRLGVVVFGAIGLCEGVFFTSPIIHFFTHSDAVREVAMTPMRMMGLVTPIIAVAMILSEALFGAGNTKFVAAAQLVLIFGVLVPGAHILGIHMQMGLMGIWTSACVYAALAATVMSIKFRGGSWKTITL
jgi:multidrug resistance protein, MATE family